MNVIEKSTSNNREQTVEFSRIIQDEGKMRLMVVEVRWHWIRGNKAPYLAVTGTVYRGVTKADKWDRGGCMHDEIMRHKWVPGIVTDAIRFHLCGSDSPMHYIANAMYHASDRDCHGKRKGEPTNFKNHLEFIDFPYAELINQPSEAQIGRFKQCATEKAWYIHEESYASTVSKGPDGKPLVMLGYWIGHEMNPQKRVPWSSCPFKTAREAELWIDIMQTKAWEIKSIPLGVGEGKIPNIEHARSSAVADWPEDDELYMPESDFLDYENLKPKLEERLPALQRRLRNVVESFGFDWDMKPMWKVEA